MTPSVRPWPSLRKAVNSESGMAEVPEMTRAMPQAMSIMASVAIMGCMRR